MEEYQINALFASKRKGRFGRRIIKTFVRNGREYQLHATKGWRSYRLAKKY